MHLATFFAFFTVSHVLCFISGLTVQKNFNGIHEEIRSLVLPVLPKVGEGK